MDTCFCKIIIDIIYIYIYIYIYIVYTFYAAPTISFGESTYSVNEHDGQALLAVVLSNPSSTDISIRVLTVDGSATGS